MKRWIWTAGVAGVALWGFFSPSTLSSAADAGHAVLTAQQALDRGSAVAASLIPAEGPLNVHVQQTMLPEADGQRRPQWEVTCDNSEGLTRLHMSIDGLTGDVLQITNIPPRRRHSGALLGREEGAKAAGRWLSAVDPFGKGAALQPSSSRRVPTGWMTRFDGSGMRAFAIVDEKTGELRWMSAGRRPVQVARMGHDSKI